MILTEDLAGIVLMYIGTVSERLHGRFLRQFVLNVLENWSCIVRFKSRF